MPNNSGMVQHSKSLLKSCLMTPFTSNAQTTLSQFCNAMA